MDPAGKVHSAKNSYGVLMQPRAESHASLVISSPSLHDSDPLPTHTPPLQAEAVVHALPSLHAAPFAAGAVPQAPVAWSQIATRHWPPGDGQTVAVPGTQAPATQRSGVPLAPVQALLSLHGTPATTFTTEHVPVPGLHSAALQTFAGWAHVTPRHRSVQTPPRHEPMEQIAPSAFAGMEHIPDCGLQVPGVWHSSVAAQVTPAHRLVHAPERHTPPVQSVFSATGGDEHAPVVGSHTPASRH